MILSVKEKIINQKKPINRGLRLLVLCCVLFSLLTEQIYGRRDKELAQELDTVKQELANLQEQVNSLLLTVDSLSNRVAILPALVQSEKRWYGYLDSLTHSVEDLESVTQAQQTMIDGLQYQMEKYTRRANYADSINFEILSQLVVLENRILSLSESLQEAQTLQSEPKSVASTPSQIETYRERYLKALSHYQNNNPRVAKELFRQLIAEDRNNDLADNAQYWIGECYYAMKQYSQAIVEFKQVFNFMNTNKADDAQFKLGLCYLAQGDREKGHAAFRELMRNFPNSEYISKAKQMMN